MSVCQYLRIRLITGPIWFSPFTMNLDSTSTTTREKGSPLQMSLKQFLRIQGSSRQKYSKFCYRNVHDETVGEAVEHENGITVLGFKFQVKTRMTTSIKRSPENGIRTSFLRFNFKKKNNEGRFFKWLFLLKVLGYHPPNFFLNL